MINAEELGVTQANVGSMMGSNNPSIARLFGDEGNFGEELGLSNDWAANIIKAIGNYGESYDKHITPLGLARGVNALWNNGGILYAAPIR